MAKSRSRSKSRSRGSKAKSRSHSKHTDRDPTVFAHFVIPLAGILSAIAARIYDMGESLTKQRQDAQILAHEHTPLLPTANLNSKRNSKAGATRTVKWVAHNTVCLTFHCSAINGTNDANGPILILLVRFSYSSVH